MGLRFSPRNIYGQTAVAAPTLQLRLTVQIQRLNEIQIEIEETKVSGI